MGNRISIWSSEESMKRETSYLPASGHFSRPEKSAVKHNSLRDLQAFSGFALLLLSPEAMSTELMICLKVGVIREKNEGTKAQARSVHSSYIISATPATEIPASLLSSTFCVDCSFFSLFSF